DGSGIATATRTLGTTAGIQRATASVGGLIGSPVGFSATATHGDPTQIAINAGDGQSATLNTAVAIDPSVVVRDRGNNPVPGVTVTFAVATGGGSVTGATPSTNSSGIATVTSWTLGTAAGTNNNTLTATPTAPGITDPVTFTASATPGAADHLVFATQPTTATAGQAISPAVVVTARD